MHPDEDGSKTLSAMGCALQKPSNIRLGDHQDIQGARIKIPECIVLRSTQETLKRDSRFPSNPFYNKGTLFPTVLF